MPKPRVMSLRKRTGKGSDPASRAPSGPQSVLVLHLDAAKLRADGLHLGGAVAMAGLASGALHRTPWIRHDIYDHTSYREVLDSHSIDRATFDIVVVVGHSNADGIQVASDRFVVWDEFARDLAPLGPRRLVLLACKAGRPGRG